MSDTHQFDLEELIAARGPVRFNGPDLTDDDTPRLTGQLARIFTLMRDGRWRTLDQIGHLTGDPPASVSAQLRHLRKARFGSHRVERRHLGRGLYEYRVAAEVTP